MTDAQVTGSVAVEVVPDATGWARKVRTAVLGDADRIGGEFGRAFGAAAARAIGDAVSAGVERSSREAERKAPAQGAAVAGRFATAFRQRLEAALKSLPEAKLNLRLTDAERELEALRASIASLSGKTVGVDISARDALAQLEQIRTRLAILGATSADPKVRLDAATAAAQLVAFQAEVAKVDGERVEVEVDADSEPAERAFGAIDAGAVGGRMRVLALTAAIFGLGPALVPIAAVGAAAMAAIAVGAVAAAGAVAVLLLALGPVIAAITAVTQAHTKSAQAASNSASRAVQLANAQDAVAAAERNLASTKADAAASQVRSEERIADARRRQGDVARQNAAAIQRADESIARAERSLTDSQRAAQKAQESLTEARRQYAQDQEDLSSRIAKGALDERAAQLRLAEAREELRKANADPRVSEMGRQQAQLGVDQAIQGLQDQQRENKRLADQQRENAEKGVDGSDAVKSAQEQLEEANRRVADSEKAVQDAISDRATTQLEAAEKTAQAERDAADAVREAREQQRRSDESLISAQQALVQAHRGVEQASVKAATAGGQAYDTAAQKMAALSPAGRSFVRFVQDELLPRFRDLSREVQTGFLPGLQRGITALLPSFGGFEDFIGSLAREMGSLAEQAGRALAGPWWQQFFGFVDDTAVPALDVMGRTLGNVATGFAGLLQAFWPVADGFGDGLLGISRRFADFGKSAGSNPAFQGFITYVRDNGPLVARTLGDIVLAAVDIVKALAPVGVEVLKIVDGFARFIQALPPAAIAAIVVGIGSISTGMLVLNGVARAGAVAMGIYRAVMGAYTLATALATGATEGLTLSMGPIIVIAVAVAAAIAALVLGVRYAYQHFGWFRAAVDAAWAGIRAASLAAWNDVIKPTFDALSSFVTDVLGPAFSWLWQNAVAPAWVGITSAVGVAWSAVKVIFDAIVYAVDKALIPAFKTYLLPAVQLVWNLIKVAVELAWSAIKVVFAAMKLYFEKTLKPNFEFIYTKIVKPVWENVSSAIETAWTKGIKPVFEKLGSFIKTTVAPAFEAGVAAIKRAWDGVVEVAKAPVRFIVSTVINGGIIDTWNKIAGWFGVKPVQRVQLPKGFATGGYLRGPGTGTSDDIIARVSNGEYVVRAAAVRKLGVSFLDQINQADKYDLAGDPDTLALRPRFADGGLIKRVRDWIPSVDPLPYVWGGVGPGGYDCSGLTGEVFARLTGRPSYRRYFVTTSDFASLGFAPGPGTYTVGVSPTHMVGNLAGLPFEAESTATGIKVGAAASPVSAFPAQWHLASLGGGQAEAEKLGISWKDPIGSVRRMLTRGLAGIGSTPFAQLAGAMPRKAIDAALDFLTGAWKDLTPFADGGLVKYDSGGWLPTGVSTVLNDTGRPEPVLTDAQWDDFVKGHSGGSSISINDLTIQMPTTAGTLDMLSHADRIRAARSIRDEILKLERSTAK